ALNLNVQGRFIKGQDRIAECVETGKIQRFYFARCTAIARYTGRIQSWEVCLKTNRVESSLTQPLHLPIAVGKIAIPNAQNLAIRIAEGPPFRINLNSDRVATPRDQWCSQDFKGIPRGFQRRFRIARNAVVLEVIDDSIVIIGGQEYHVLNRVVVDEF